MKLSRAPAWPMTMSVIAVAAVVMAWAMFTLGGDHTGARRLSDVAGATVEIRRMSATAGIETAARPGADGWSVWDGRHFIYAGRGEAVWVRVTLRNPESLPVQGVLTDAEWFEDRADLFMADEARPGEWRQWRSGEAVRTAERALWGRDPAFVLTVPARGAVTAYLRLEDFYEVYARLVWWPDMAAFVAARTRDTMAEAAYFGGLLALLFYNAVLWVRVRFSDTGYYLGYLGAFAVMMFAARGGLAATGWALGSPGLETLVAAAMGLMAFFVACFAGEFLELRTRAPRLARMVRLVAAVMAVLAAGALAMPWMPHTAYLNYVMLGGALTHATMLLVAVVVWRQGAWQARYFVAAFGTLFSGIVPTIWGWLTVVPLDDMGVPANAMLVGSGLEMLLLSMAIADRLARLQREKLTAQEEATREAEQRHAVEEAYADEMELEVRERTHELLEANADKDRMLAVLGHDLRSPLAALTQLAEQLRMGSRAPLAPPLAGPLPGFAREVAGTGRQLLLLIEDIVLWSELRGDGARGAPLEQRVSAIVSPAVALHAAAAEQRGVEISVEVPDELTVTTDLVLAQTLVRNLVSNAVKFARRRVTIVAQATGADVRLTVRDDGPGLPGAVAARLRGAGETGAGGSGMELEGGGGLGLRLCQEIATALGVRLDVVTAGAAGTALSVILPVRRPVVAGNLAPEMRDGGAR